MKFVFTKFLYVIILLTIHSIGVGGVCFGQSTGKTVFVSSTEGDDGNSGESADTPLFSIKKALTVGDTILLKANDVFYERVELRKGKISSYGKGRKPVISGYKRIAKANWGAIDEHIWRICLTNDNYLGYDTDGSSLQNNVGCLHEYDKDLIHGRKLKHLSDLAEDWDIWQTEHHKKGEATDCDFDTLYLYLNDNPNFLRIEFSVGGIALRMSNAIIENVRIEGFGFGISAGRHSIIRKCEIDAIGGQIQLNNSQYVCYGNGIEFWIRNGLEDCLVEECKISRCYDCACTIQGREPYPPSNIRFRNNVIFDCCQAWEDFFTTDNPDAIFKDCIFENNVIVNSGNTTGFGYTKGRTKCCHVLENNYLGNKGMIFRNNTFVGGNYYCAAKYNGAFKSGVWEGNTCYIKRGEWLIRCINKGDEIIRIPVEKGNFRTLKAATDEAIRRYREMTGDETTRFVIKSDGNINKRIKKLKKQYSKR